LHLEGTAEVLQVRKQISWLRVRPALLRWSRVFMCLLFSITILAHVAHDFSAIAQPTENVGIVASSTAHHSGMPAQPKAIQHCAYVGCCSQALPSAIPLNAMPIKSVILAPTADNALASDILGRHFRPPRSLDQA
jgi:hypothetical protein